MSMKAERFIVDSNALITPYRMYYPFDFASTFWKQLEYHIKQGSIVLLDMVKSELQNGEDSLCEWIAALPNDLIVDRRTPEIIKAYSEILTYIQDAPCYTDRALKGWSKTNIADPWIVAAGCVYGYTIVTFEQPDKPQGGNNKTNKVKIPDICTQFDVACKDLFYMMRQLSFKF